MVFLLDTNQKSSSRFGRRLVPWSLQVPTKVRLFIWKLVSNLLATRVNLKTRRICEDDVCPACMSCKESVEHLFLGCYWVQSAWLVAGLNVDVNIVKVMNLENGFTIGW